jgi:hypothetical protein
MTLAGWKLWVALGTALLAGGVGGSFLAGWRNARGVPPVSASADAGVQISMDAGVASKSDCSAVIEHWRTVAVPGPVRYVTLDAGSEVERPGPVVYIMVPDVRLTGHTEAMAALDAVGTASASAHVDILKAPPTDKLFEAGPLFLHGVAEGDNIIGGLVGANIGPLGLKGAVAGSTRGGLYVGGAAVWRF